MKHLFTFLILLLAGCSKEQPSPEPQCSSPTEAQIRATIDNDTRPATLAAYLLENDCITAATVDYCGTCESDVTMVGNAQQGVINVSSIDGNLNRIYFAILQPMVILKVE